MTMKDTEIPGATTRSLEQDAQSVVSSNPTNVAPPPPPASPPEARYIRESVDPELSSLDNLK